MNLLVDTHVLIWFLNDSDELTASHYETLENPQTQIFVSVVSIFEIATKVKLGKLALPYPFSDNLTMIELVFDYSVLDLKLHHADLAGRLRGIHKDPFDRLLAAQAIVEDMAIMTIDARIADLGARVVW